MPPTARIFLILLHHEKQSIAFTWRGLCKRGWQEGRLSLLTPFTFGLCGMAKPSLAPNSSKLVFSTQKNAGEAALRPAYAKQNIFPAHAISRKHHPVLAKSISSMK